MKGRVAVANEKGGAGKTTTAINVGAALGEAGERVLLVDLDARADLTLNLGIRLAAEAPSVYGLFADESLRAGEVIQEVTAAGVSVAPAERDLAAVEVLLGEMEAGERVALVRRVLKRLERGMDWMLIDCPPGLSRLVVAVLQCVDCVLVPQQCSFTALHGLRALEQTIGDIERAGGRRPPTVLIALTMTTRTLHSARVEETVRRRFGEAVLTTTVPTSVRVQEAPEYALPVTLYDPTNRAAEAYRALAKEVMERAT